MPRATVVCPTFNHGPLLHRSIGSARAQTVADLEILIVGDGVDGPTREVVQELAAADERIRFFDHPKGPRRGEAYRDAVLRDHARGPIVCYLGDDDLWLHDHVATMEALLEEADFAHAPPVMVLPDGRLKTWGVDVSMPDDRRRVFTRLGFFPLSSQAHTMDMYRRLPHGWRTTPEGTATDVYMAMQFLDEATCRAVSGTRPTYVAFPDGFRGDWTLEERARELDDWSARLATLDGRVEFYVNVQTDLRARLVSLENSRTWRLRQNVTQALARRTKRTTWRAGNEVRRPVS
jgi:glycosyltransferase involved in cell wall biosynthesis